MYHTIVKFVLFYIFTISILHSENISPGKYEVDKTSKRWTECVKINNHNNLFPSPFLIEAISPSHFVLSQETGIYPPIICSSRGESISCRGGSFPQLGIEALIITLIPKTPDALLGTVSYYRKIGFQKTKVLMCEGLPIMRIGRAKK